MIVATASVAPRELRSALRPPDRTTAADDGDATGPIDRDDHTTVVPVPVDAVSLTHRTEPTSAGVIV